MSPNCASHNVTKSAIVKAPSLKVPGDSEGERKGKRKTGLKKETDLIQQSDSES